MSHTVRPSWGFWKLDVVSPSSCPAKKNNNYQKIRLVLVLRTYLQKSIKMSIYKNKIISDRIPVPNIFISKPLWWCKNNWRRPPVRVSVSQSSQGRLVSLDVEPLYDGTIGRSVTNRMRTKISFSADTVNPEVAKIIYLIVIRYHHRFVSKLNSWSISYF